MTTERIVTEYTADTRSFTRGTNRYARQLAGHERLVNRRLDQIDQRWERSARAVGMATTALVGLGSAAAALSGFRSLAEEWRGVERALTSIGMAGGGAEAALVDLAIRTRSEVSGTAKAVQRFAKSTGDDLDTTVRRVETLQKLLASGGASGGERASVSLQLGQALQSGVLSGDEYRSISENAPAEFLDALAAAAGVTRAELKSVSTEQKLTTEIVLDALDGLANRADEIFGSLAVSGEESVAVLRAGLVAYVGQVDESLGAMAVLNGAMVGLGEYLSGAGEGAQNMAAALQILAGAAVGLAGSRGLGAVSEAFRSAAAARLKNVEAARQDSAASRQAVTDANMELAAARERRRLADSEYQRRVYADAATKKAGNERRRAIDAETRALQKLQAAESNAAVRTSALTAAQSRLSLATRVTTSSMRALNGVMAFFGGPVGAAITLAGALAVAISRIQTSAEKIESSLNIASDAASRFETAMSAVSSVDSDLAQAKSDMAAASATYRAAVADEATVAAQTAQAEVTAINTRIDALEKLRAARLAEAQVAALDAQAALSEASEPLRQAVRADITPRNTRNGRADQALSEAEITSALDARIEAIGAELAAGADLSDQDRVIARAAAEAQATAAKIELLSQALEKAASVDASAVDPAPGGSGISDLLDGANLASRRLAALETQAARLRGALAEGSLDDSTAAEAREALAGVETDIARLRTSDVGDAGLSRLLDSASLASRQLSELRAEAATLRTALDSGDLDATTAREAQEALTGIEEAITRLRDGAASGSGGAVTLVDGDQITSLQDAEQLLARLSEQAQTQSERRAEQARRVAEARIVLVARYGEESDAVARLDEATRRLNNSGASAAGSLANMLATTALQAKNLEDGLKQVLVQLLQMNGVDAFTQLFSGAGAGFLSTLFGGSGASGGGGASVPAFAGGGIMTSAGRVPLRAYSSGGIARSAQLALFGEGRKPEAYVPLPDGRTIPVTIRTPITPIMPVSPGAQVSGSTTVFAPVNHFHGVTGSMAEIESMVTRVTKTQTEKAIARQKREGLI